MYTIIGIKVFTFSVYEILTGIEYFARVKDFYLQFEVDLNLNK